MLSTEKKWLDYSLPVMEGMREELAARDPVVLAARTGTQFSKSEEARGRFTLEYLNRPYHVSYPEFEAQVYEKDGYLEILYQGLRWRLDEYRPGLFFTSEGGCLDLRGEIPTWQNYRMRKIR